MLCLSPLNVHVAMGASVCTHTSKTHMGTSFFFNVFMDIACEMYVHDE